MKNYVIAPILTLIVGGIFEAVGFIVWGGFGLGAVPAVIVMGTFLLASSEKGKNPIDKETLIDCDKDDSSLKMFVDALKKNK